MYEIHSTDTKDVHLMAPPKRNDSLGPSFLTLMDVITLSKS